MQEQLPPQRPEDKPAPKPKPSELAPSAVHITEGA